MRFGSSRLKRRHRVHLTLQPLALLLAHGRHIAAIGEQGRRLCTIKAHSRGDLHQHLGLAHILAFAEECRKQREFELGLQAVQACPVQQLVRTESIHHAHALEVIEGEAQGLTQFRQARPRALALFWISAVFHRHMLTQVLALLRHVRVQLEGVPGNGGLELARQRFESPHQLFVADDAPGADNIGDNIDLERDGLHCVGHVRYLKNTHCG
jgi:hypothetical protein